jgi:hypothetical protein
LESYLKDPIITIIRNVLFFMRKHFQIIDSVFQLGLDGPH